jgi:hypothetical protein
MVISIEVRAERMTNKNGLRYIRSETRKIELLLCHLQNYDDVVVVAAAAISAHTHTPKNSPLRAKIRKIHRSSFEYTQRFGSPEVTNAIISIVVVVVKKTRLLSSMFIPIKSTGRFVVSTTAFLIGSKRPTQTTTINTSSKILHRMSSSTTNMYDAIQEIIGTDAGGRGMKSLIVPGDLQLAAECLASSSNNKKKNAIVLSGFPCCVNETPPTETDGPPGTFAIARAAAVLGYHVTVVTDACNEAVFAAGWNGLAMPPAMSSSSDEQVIQMQVFPPIFSTEDETRFQQLAQECDLLISCERAGPAKDGNCYTMRGINMNEKGLIAPLDRLVKECNCKLISIGDGGNELGMGKVIQHIIDNPKIANGDQIGCVVPADYLIAASVSNWGGYALAAAAAIARATATDGDVRAWVEKCLPTEAEEVALLKRCVAAGCRDGVSGKMEATVDGMPLETSMKCLEDIHKVAISS